MFYYWLYIFYVCCVWHMWVDAVIDEWLREYGREGKMDGMKWLVVGDVDFKCMISEWYHFDVSLIWDWNHSSPRNMRGHYIHIFPGFSRSPSPFFKMLKFAIFRPIRIHYPMSFGNTWKNTRGLVMANRFLTGRKCHGSTTNHHTPKPITFSTFNFTNSIHPLSLTSLITRIKIYKNFIKYSWKIYNFMIK